MIRFLHTSDWHLGMSRHYLDEEAAPRFRQIGLDTAAVNLFARESAARRPSNGREPPPAAA